MKLCELTVANIEEVKQIFLEIFSAAPWNDTWTDEQLHRYVFELMGNDNSLAFGYYENGNLIGLSLGRIKHWYEGTEYWIDEFGICPQKQGQGSGSAFLREIECQLKKRGITGIVLFTERMVPAFQFYLQNGFSCKEEQAFLVKSV